MQIQAPNLKSNNISMPLSPDSVTRNFPRQYSPPVEESVLSGALQSCHLLRFLFLITVLDYISFIGTGGTIEGSPKSTD